MHLDSVQLHALPPRLLAGVAQVHNGGVGQEAEEHGKDVCREASR